MKKRDLIPLKIVAEEMGMSRASLWRARRSDIPDFPKPTIIRQLVYWKRSDLEKLEAALMQYRGRVVFERNRDAGLKMKALKRSREAASKKHPGQARGRSAHKQQLSLFGE